MNNPDKNESAWVTEPGEEQNPQKKSLFFKGVELVFDFLQSIALGGAFFIVIYLFVVQPHQVKGNSMYPTYKDKEYILTDKISYKFRSPERGEIIILKSPKNPDIDFIKRIIGLPGDKIKIADGHVYVNDGELSETYVGAGIDTPVFPGGFIQENVEVIIPPEHFFVMGDNRPGSSDSREFGFVPFANIIGRVVFRYYPFSEAGIVVTPEYNL